MTTPVLIPIRVEGADTAKSELRGVKASILAFEKEAIDSARRVSAGRLAILKGEAAETSALLSKLRAEESFASGIGRSRGARSSLTPSAASFPQGALGADAAADLLKGALPVLRGALDYASSALRQFGGFVLADVVRPALALQTQAQQAANASGGKLTANDITGKVRAAGLRNNMGSEELLGASAIFQDKTGDSKLSLDVLGSLATLSKGRGFDIKQLSEMAGSVYKEGMGAKDVESLLLKMTAQGDMGSITLGQMAKMGGKLTAPASSFQGSYADTIAMSGALMQSGRKGFGTVDSTAVGLASFVKDAIKSGSLYKGITKNSAGVDMIADPAALIGDIFRKTSGNATTLKGDAGGKFTDTGASYVGAYRQRFTEAYDTARAGGADDKGAREDAAKAVETFIRSFMTANTTMEAESAKRDAVMRTDGEKWDHAVNVIKDKLLAVMPSLTKFIDTFATNAPVIASAAVTLARALLDLASLVLKLLPETDTREKRRLEAMDANDKKRAELETSVTRGKAAGRDTYREESELLKLTGEREALGEGKDIAPKLSAEDVLKKIGDSPRNRAYLARIDQDPSVDIDALQRETDAYRFGGGGKAGGVRSAPLSDENRAFLSVYRDQKVTEREGQEANIKAGAKGVGAGAQDAAASIAGAAVKALGDAAAAATKQLVAVGDAAQHVNRSAPYGSGGK